MNSRFLNYLILNSSFNDKVALFNSKAAVPLYLYQNHLWANKNRNSDIAFSFLEEVLSQINMNTPLTYGDGIAGIGVLLEYLSQNHFFEGDTNELLEECELYLLREVYGAKLQEAGIANGISGLGLYFLCRLHAITPAHFFKQLRFKESIIACVDQIDTITDKSKANGLQYVDISVWNGLSGVLMFLERVHSLQLYEPFVEQLAQKIYGLLNRQLQSSRFSWHQAEAYFCLLHCDLVKSNPLLKIGIMQSFKQWLHAATSTEEELDFYDTAFVALWLHLIAQEHNISKAELLSNDLKQYVKNVLDENDLGNLFPYNAQEQCVPVGLYRGVCGTALPLLSLESGGCNWLSILGINITSRYQHVEEISLKKNHV